MFWDGSILAAVTDVKSKLGEKQLPILAGSKPASRT
jgi:hypothetical protein